jgi:hypothetical protein
VLGGTLRKEDPCAPLLPVQWKPAHVLIGEVEQAR